MKKDILIQYGIIAILLFSVKAISQVTTQTFVFTGTVQSYTVPNCVNSLTIQLWGAQGASSTLTAPGGTGGLGGYVSGVITVTPGQVLNLYVGGQNGYNGGGLGGVNGNSVFAGPSLGTAANGGGASDIRIGGTTLADRVLVAGGGGGGANVGTWSACQPASPAGNGGAGGGNIGAAGNTGSSTACSCAGTGGNGGQGGSSIIGGAAGTYNGTICKQTWVIGSNGAFGIGGNGSTSYHNGTGGGGGGGGGYYGGGSGGSGSDTTPGGGGGGGSSFTGIATSTISTQGIKSGNGLITITSGGSAALAVVASSTALCSGQSSTLTASGVSTYTWSTGSNLSSIVVMPSTSTTYSVSGNSGTCIATTTISVAVNSSPTVIVNSGSICIGNSFTIIPSGASTYTIQGGSSIVSPTTNVTYTVVGTSTNSCLSNVANSNITVSSIPTISVNSGSICSGNAFTITPNGASTYTYSSGSAIVSPTASTVYTVTGSNGACVGSPVVSNVTVNALPSVSAASSNTAFICIGSTATLTAAGANTYVWNTTATTAVIAVSPTTTTSYTVTGTNAAGCSANAVLTQSVNTCTGINSNVLASNILVYPNPSNGIFNVQLENAATIEVTDVLGRVILTDKVNAGNYQLNLGNNVNGVYFVKATVDGKTKTVKIVKE